MAWLITGPIRRLTVARGGSLVGSSHRGDVTCGLTNASASIGIASGVADSLLGVPTLVLDPPPIEIAKLIESRRRLGQDIYDEFGMVCCT